MDEAINPDTETILLLCGTFSRESEPDPKPLTLREYNAIAVWLAGQERRPGDLLKESAGLYGEDEPGLPEAARVRALLARGMQMAAAVERWQRLGLWVIGRGEERYPERLRRNLGAAAPALLFGAGDMARLALGGLAIVGARDIDDEGLEFTGRVAERWANAGRQVVSGGARGVDRAALAAALEAGGGVVAVLPDRLDRAATARETKEQIRAGVLTLISPFEPEANFTVGRAMGRNKVIYAAADFALVVRFTKGEGGTWAGAMEQLKRNAAAAPTVPVFVRVANNPEDGWRELRGKGALPFPEEELWGDDVEQVLRRAAAASTPRDLWTAKETQEE